MSPKERLKAMANWKGEIWYKSFVSCFEDEDLCQFLIENKDRHARLGTCEYATDLITDEGVFYSYRHLDEM